jgi:ubiquitin-protein ligase E3 A
MREIFDQSYGLFSENNESRLVWFSSNETCDESAIAEYNLLGTIIALALYNSISINLNLPLVLFKQLMQIDYRPTLSDLREIDPVLGRSLQLMLDFDGDVEEVFSYTFRIGASTITGDAIAIDLIEGGDETPVTNANRECLSTGTIY